MFFVFAINEPAERARLEKRLHALNASALAKKFASENQRLSAASVAAKVDQAVAALVEEDVKKLRPKPLAEFATPSSAEDYVKVLRATPGFREVSVKARVLAPPPRWCCEAWPPVRHAR